MLVYKSCIELNIGEDDYCAYDVVASCDDIYNEGEVDDCTASDLERLYHNVAFDFCDENGKYIAEDDLITKHGKAFQDALEQAKFTYDESETDGYIQMLQEEAAEYAREDF